MCLFWEFCREENMVKKIELGICVNVQHLTIAHSEPFVATIKHFAQILSGREGEKNQQEGLERMPGRGQMRVSGEWARGKRDGENEEPLQEAGGK